MTLYGDQPISALIKIMNKLMKENEHVIRKNSRRMVDGPQRLRGIAGSGKTRQICYNAASLHNDHPDWNIAVVFNTQSLYEEVVKNIRVAIDELDGEWNREKLIVYHAWGSKQHEGLVSHLCKLNGLSSGKIFTTLKRNNRNAGFGHLCKYILENYSIKPYFHALFIDEGQDLVYSSPDVLFDKKQPFYYLAYQSLHLANSKKPKNRRLVWAYDEYQNLHTLQIPKIKEIFGEDPPYVDSQFMNVCYRTPGCIILAAHAICMGLLNTEGMIAGPTEKNAWHALGYQVTGDFRKTGSLIDLYRPPELSPNTIPMENGMPIELSIFDYEREETNWLAGRIKRHIEADGLDPSTNILIIDLTPRWCTRGKTLHKEHGINIYIPSRPRSNEFNSLEPNSLPRKFRDSNSITLTNVEKAKGNEADIVYIIGLQEIAQKGNGMNINMRNKLFVAMTRSKGWIHLSGTGRYPLYDEISKVVDMLKKDQYRIQFRYHTPKYPINPWDGDPEGDRQTDLDAYG